MNRLPALPRPWPARRSSAGALLPAVVALACVALGAPASLLGADAAAPPAREPIAQVVVEARRLPVENLVDRKVYSITADLQSQFGSVTDVLVAIPSVDVGVDGTVALRGDTSVLILLDGQPLAQVSGPLVAEALRQIPAADIDKIEVITNPPAQYKAEGAAGIINIITRKDHRAGLTGTANANSGEDHRSSLGASANYSDGGLNIFGGASLRQDNRPSRSVTDLTVPGAQPAETSLSHDEFTQDSRGRTIYLRAGVKYEFNDQQSVRLWATHGERSGTLSGDEAVQDSLPPGTLTGSTDRASSGEAWSLNTDQRFVFEQKLPRDGELLTVTLHRSTYHVRGQSDYVNESFLPAASPTYEDLFQSEDLLSTGLDVDYVLPVSSSQNLRLGGAYQRDLHVYGNSGDTLDPVTGMLTVEPDIANDFRYWQQITAAYASYQSAIGAWNLQGGLRFERTELQLVQLTDELAVGRSYAQLYPSVHLQRTLSETSNLFFSVTERISRPDPASLNPYVDRTDPEALRAGNPYLLPKTSQSYDLAYSLETPQVVYGLNAYLRRSRNGITDVAQTLGPQVVLITRENLPRNQSGGVEFTAYGRLTPRLRFGLSGNLFYNQLSDLSLGTQLKSATVFNVKGNIDYRASAFDSLQVYASRTGRSLTAQGYVDPVSQVNFGYKRQIRYNLLAIATVTDAFDGQRSRRVTEAATFTDISHRYVPGHVVSLGFVYSFAWRKAREEAREQDEP